jgi:PAS domain S-box-containing protein
MSGLDAPHVLIVDDQPRNLDALEAMLSTCDCTLVRAQSPDEALLKLLRYDFAAIVLDIRMPGMSGIELATLIKQRKRSQYIPILFLTAHLMDEQDVLRGYGVGAVDYLSKPINATILQSKIGGFVDLYRKGRALSELNEALQREIAERERAQIALQHVNQELEQRVQDRTAALVRAHQGVRENEERLRMAMEVAHMAAWEWHLASGDMTWSTDPEALFGFPTGSFGRELRMFRALHPDDRARTEQNLAHALRSGAFEHEYRLVRPDGSIVWIMERGRVIAENGDAPERMVGISRDVTADREATREREELLERASDARDEAERQMRLKDEFLATLSHELRTPMNAILGWLSMVQNGTTNRNMASVFAIIQRNAQLQAKLIDDLLDMNRVISGNLQLELTPVDLGTMLQATLQGLQPAADAKGVQLLAVVDSSVRTIGGDARRLQQVLWNLVHNGIKFTPQGGRVDVRVEPDDDQVRITVQDNGQGISPAFLPHVFERFRQQDSSATRQSFGLGLGLSIVKHMVELHGGTIRAISAGDGKGATFIVHLPAGHVPVGPFTQREPAGGPKSIGCAGQTEPSGGTSFVNR